MALAVLTVAATGCGSSQKPIKVAFHVGETRVFDASQLPARSILTCRVNRREAGRTVPYIDTIEMPSWSTWDRQPTGGWGQSNVVGDIWFGMRPAKHGSQVRVSCARSPGGLD